MVLFHSDAKLSLTKEQDSRSYCQNLTTKISKVADIPAVCNMFPEVVKEMKMRIDEKDAAIATQGMRSGGGQEVRRSRTTGSQYQAQVTRRYTQTRRFSKQPSENK